MEPVNGTPTENEYKGDDIKLRVKLNAALENELEKSPDEMDTEKIDSVIGLLNRLDGDKAADQEMTKEQFAEKYLKGIIRHRRKGTVYSRAAIFFAGLVLCISICNFISVRATDMSLFRFVKEKAYLFCYETIGNRSNERNSGNQIDKVQDVAENIYESWELLTEDENIDILVPGYIPHGFEEMPIHIQKITSDDIGISRQYVNGECYIRSINEQIRKLHKSK